jgi:hypothetical protein
MRMPPRPSPRGSSAISIACCALRLPGTGGPLMDTTPLVDWAPLRLLLLAACIALLPLAWVWLRQRGATPGRAWPR